VKTEIKREGDRVWIENLPEAQMGERWDMLLRSLEYILKERGENTTLNDLMVYSGDAFSLSHADSWQYMAYLFIPTNTLINVTSSLGYNGHWLWSDLQGMNSGQQVMRETMKVLEEIWGEIDAGRPVMVGGCADQGCTSWSIVIGYDRKRSEQCHIGIGEAYRWTGIRGISFPCNEQEGLTDHWNGRKRAQFTGHIGGWRANLGFVVESKTTTPSEQERLTVVLKRAVDLFHHQKIRIGNENFYFGEEACQQWAKDLVDLNYPADTEKAIPEGSWGLYSMENIDYMVDIISRGRIAAAEFLEKTSENFPECRDRLRTAARNYREEVEITKEAFAAYDPPWSESKTVEEFLSNKKQLNSASSSILQMLEKEKNAIAEIEETLAILERENK